MYAFVWSLHVFFVTTHLFDDNDKSWPISGEQNDPLNMRDACDFGRKILFEVNKMNKANLQAFIRTAYDDSALEVFN